MYRTNSNQSYILIADSDPLPKTLRQTFLARLGLNVEIVRTGYDAVQRLRRWISILVLNPGLFSLEEQKKLSFLWKSARFEPTPLIIMRSPDIAVQESLIECACRQILKPVNWDIVGRQICDILNMPCRTSPRIRVDFPVEAEWVRPFHARSHDFSPDGLQILTEEKVPTQQRLMLSFLVPEMGKIFRCTGKVVWKARYRGNGKFRYGIALQHPNPQNRTIIRDFIEEKMADEAGDIVDEAFSF